MERESLHRERRLPAKIAAALLSFLLVGLPASGQNLDNKPKDKEDKQKTESPIKHVIVLIGENRTFDHLFATYVPQSSDTISNLLSKGIIKADGTPGPNFSQAAQFQAVPPFKTDFFTLPAVSFVKPDGLLDGHPASSKLDLFEAMTKKTMDHLTARPDLFAETALFITFDEGGGYYDSGYIQPLDFFGDGPRIPLIVVSPFSTGGHVSHSYTDHVSILKFIERNWKLKPLTTRSRDNFPNPVSEPDNAYVPLNSPAIGDLFDLFQFERGCGNDGHDGKQAEVHGDNR
jgi:phospholipase C